VGNLIVGAAVGFGGRLMRTVSFLGWTLPVSAFFGGTGGTGGFGLGTLSAITRIVGAKLGAVPEGVKWLIRGGRIGLIVRLISRQVSSHRFVVDPLMISRRQALQQTAALTVACAAGGALVSCASGRREAAVPGPFSVPPLGYEYDALEPYLDVQTMRIHHDRHHRAYVDGLNRAVAGRPELAQKTIEDLLRDLEAVPPEIRQAVRHHGGGHYNHSLFWKTLRRNRDGKPKGALADACKREFGGFKDFKERMSATALSVFGSGWAWLTLDGRKLRIESTPEQDTPWAQGRVPLLGLDVWEHAYYLRYQNRRSDYVAAFWNVIDWPLVAAEFQRWTA
jgi:Fe-Mn family superoxide dismutase